MKIVLKTQQSGDVTIVDVAGRIQLGEETNALREVLRTLLETNQLNILLNLGEVSYIDSSGLGELVSAFTRVNDQGGQIKLLNLTKRVSGLLQITKLYTVFDVFDDEARATRSYTAAANPSLAA